MASLLDWCHIAEDSELSWNNLPSLGGESYIRSNEMLSWDKDRVLVKSGTGALIHSRTNFASIKPEDRYAFLDNELEILKRNLHQKITEFQQGIEGVGLEA